MTLFKPMLVSHEMLTFQYGLRSFTGFLEGTHKAAHTIASYRCDLRSFQTFLENHLSTNSVNLSQITLKDLERYHDFLRSQGERANTRRRKLLTVRRFLKYLVKRGKFKADFSQQLPAPGKVEKVPFTLSSDDLLKKIRVLPIDHELRLRNKLILWTLAETGCLVSEVTRIRFEDWNATTLQITGKFARTVPISPKLRDAVEDFQAIARNKAEGRLFKLTPRAVELLVRASARALGASRLTPRTFRRSIVLKWFQEGVTREEIQRRLGLKTDYAFRVFEPLISKKAATSTSQKPPKGL